MENTQLLNTAHNINQILENARQEAQNTLSHIILQAYWSIGQLLDDAHIKTHELDHLDNIAHTCKLERSKLIRCLQFYQTWPNENPINHFSHLNWSHYKLLIPIQSDDVRQHYMQRAQEQKWTVRMLSQKIKENKPLPIIPDQTTPSAPATLERRQEALHIYKATVERVVDGDTLLVNIDLGFDVWVKKRLRLRGINAPEPNAVNPQDASRAQAATDFVKARFPKDTVIVMQTFQVDLHGRFVSDVFYLEGSTDKEKIFKEGVFLNQELLDEGLVELF